VNFAKRAVVEITKIYKNNQQTKLDENKMIDCSLSYNILILFP